ncbi:MAG: hypothetical protein HQK51_21845, partial [Oligoflexia bacterium]|nr:hypothetical protein [Oligoflexia bacterium]
TQRTQDSIKNEYHNLEGEFDRRKSEEKEDYNRSPLLNMAKENLEKMKKDIDDDVKKIKELTDQRE